MRKKCYSLILIAVYCLICLGSQSIRAQEGKEKEFDSEKKFAAKTKR